jgi:mannose-binding lectin 1
VDVDFRATGPERGGGNLQIWYAKNGQVEVGTSSIYTVGRFDGLALVIDQYAGSVGLPIYFGSVRKANGNSRVVSSEVS